MSQTKLTHFFQKGIKISVRESTGQRNTQEIINSFELRSPEFSRPPTASLPEIFAPSISERLPYQQTNINSDELRSPTTPCQKNIYYCMMFDGCSKGNPGPSGAGAVLYENEREIWSRAIYVGNRETNNIAEYTGLLLGLNEAVRRQIKNIVVKGDSEVVIKQMLGKYKVKSENLLDIYNQAKQLEQYFDKIDYIHVYRHLNTRADALSNEGLAKIQRSRL